MILMLRLVVLAILLALSVAGATREASSKIDPSLSDATGKVTVILLADSQPVLEHAEDAWNRVRFQIEQLGESIREITKPIPNGIRLNPEQEAHYPVRTLSVLEQELVYSMNIQIDQLQTRAMDELIQVCREECDSVVDAIAALVRKHRGVVLRSTAGFVSVTAVIDASQLRFLAASSLIRAIDSDRPTAPELDNSAATVGAPTFWNAGLTGGVYDAGILDSGVYHLHPNLVAHPFTSQNGDNYTDTHGTQMAGIFASNHASNRGLAYGFDTLSAAYASGTESISMTGMNYLMVNVPERAECVNYSYGNGTANTADYRAIDQFFDGVVDSFNVMVSKSTGNGGFGTGTPTITHPAPAYNLMAVANMDDKGTLTRSDDTISTSSSRGPTLGGRKKPDITAPGTSITTTTPTSGFSSVTGTSPAAPHVGSSILLLRNFGLTDVRACKAVLLNAADAKDDRGTASTADDIDVAGSFWNRRYGWGYLDLTEAYMNAADVFLHTISSPNAARQFKLYKGFMFMHEKATLTWHRHVLSNGATYPTQIRALSNLDLSAFDASNGNQLAQSASTIDNVEQISVANDGNVVLKVLAAAAFDPQVPVETFALATEEGFSPASGPTLTFKVTYPPKVGKSFAFPLKVEIWNNGDLSAIGASLQLSGTGFGGTGTTALGNIAPGGYKAVVLFPSAPASTGNRTFSLVATSTCAGESFGSNASYSILVVN